LAGATKEQVLAVLTEELGHHLDRLLNASDTVGDEGEFFALFLGNENISVAESSLLRTQDDWFTLAIQGVSLFMEGALVSSSNITTTGSALFLSAPAIRGNSLYTIVRGPSWQDAQNSAASTGGYLVTIGSAEENAFLVTSYYKSQYTSLYESVWIGLTDQYAEGTWQWIGGESVVYTNWGSGEPDGAAVYKGQEDYAEFILFDNYNRDPGQWGDNANATSGGYIGGVGADGIAEIPLTLSITLSATPK
jgi:hypothetical protein